MNKTFGIWFVWNFLFLFTLSGCATAKSFGPYMGKVVDAETEEPIEGAVVFMKIMTITPNVGGWEYHFADAKEVLTDSKGEFYIELQGAPLNPGHFWYPDPKFLFFKPGYGVFPSYPGSSVDILEKDTTYIFPEKTYVTIKLPALRTTKDRKLNLRKIDCYRPTIPYAKRQNCFRMINEERVTIGLKPMPIPNN